MKILLIEDNPGDARLVQEILKEEPVKLTVDVAEKLDAGLKLLASQDVDLVLLDLGLPDSRGLETFTKLQNEFPNLPVVIMSSVDDEALAVQAIRLGAQDYFVKGQINGKLLRHALIHADERKKVGEEIRRQAGLLDISHDAIFTWEIGGGITYWNQGARELYGFSTAEALEQNPHVLFHTSNADVNHFREELWRNKQWEGELTHITKNGRQITVDSRMVVIQEHRRKQLVLETNRDVTERKKAEQLKDEFIGLVSHEIRTPLTIIIGALAVAVTEGVSPEQAKQLIHDAQTSADNLTNIVDNLLELSRWQSNRLSLQPEPVNIEEIASSVTQKLQVSPMHHLVVDIPSDLPPVIIDRLRIERVLYNLVDNAIKYSPEGGDVKVFSYQQDSLLVIGVSD